jgi:hypothetical protein
MYYYDEITNTTKKSLKVLLDDKNEAGLVVNADRAEMNFHTSSPECTTKETHDM